MEMPKAPTLAIAALALVIAGALGYGVRSAMQERAEQRAVASVVGETTAQLRQALSVPSAGIAERIDGNLRVAQTWSNRPLADAAEHYLLGAREIARKRADATRHARQFAASRAALAAHMGRAGARDGAWIRAASQLKRQVENDHFALESSLHALAELLSTLPEAQKRLEPYGAAALTLEDALRLKARQQVFDEAKRAALELQRARSLATRF